jgi:hypothetical protein
LSPHPLPRPQSQNTPLRRQDLILGSANIPQCLSPNQVNQVSLLVNQAISPLGALRQHHSLPTYLWVGRVKLAIAPFQSPPYSLSWTCMNPSANKKILFLAIDSRPSPGLTLNLSSNNPFRNRAASPSLSDGQRSPFDPPPRPVSRNPFLDASSTTTFPQPPVGSPDKMSFATDSTAPLTGNAAELFVRHI